MAFSHPFPRITSSASREADGHAFRDAASLALRTNATVVVAVVDLDRASETLVLEVLVHAALANLPDAGAFVIPHLAVSHDLKNQGQDVQLRSPDDPVGQARVELGQLLGKLIDRDERLVHLVPHVLREVADLARHPDDVVVGALVGPAVGSELVARVPFGGVEELRDDAAPCYGEKVLDLILEEDVVEFVPGEVDLGLLLLGGLTVGPGSSLLRHMHSQIRVGAIGGRITPLALTYTTCGLKKTPHALGLLTFCNLRI